MTRALLLGLALCCMGISGLLGCAEPAPADHSAPDMGGCVGLSATLSDAGPVAHVYPYPDGTACEGGVCVAGECVP